MHSAYVSVAITWLAQILTNVDASTFSFEPVERPLRIGSFNIQNLGKSKTQNDTVMEIVKKVLLRYDLVLVQEIVTTDETLMANLQQQMNKHMPSESTYLMEISERLGRGTAKEQYAFIYRSDKLKSLGGHVYPDLSDDFMRPPYIVHFSSPTLRDVKSLLAIGIHTQPKNAANETSSLADVYDYASAHYKVKDAILMGDMNAGCSNVRIGDWDSIELWTRPEFTWLIKHDMDTTISANCCPYDRFVLAGNNIVEAVIWKSIGIFNFQEAYVLSTPLTLAVSDHWPIEFQLKGTASEIAEENLRSRLCVVVDDARSKTLPPAIESQKTTMGFKIYPGETVVTLEKSSSDLEELMASLEALTKRYPTLISAESLSAVLYKVAFGALEDTSSHQEIAEQEFWTDVEFDKELKTTEISVCTYTMLN